MLLAGLLLLALAQLGLLWLRERLAAFDFRQPGDAAAAPAE